MSPNGMFLRLFILDFFPQWNLKIFLLSLSNPLFVLESFRDKNGTAIRFLISIQLFDDNNSKFKDFFSEKTYHVLS